MRIYWGIPEDHPCGNFLIISPQKFGGNEGEFSVCIFPPPFPAQLPCGSFPCVSLKNLQMQYIDIGRVQAIWWFDVIFWWIRIFSGLGKLPSNFNPDNAASYIRSRYFNPVFLFCRKHCVLFESYKWDSFLLASYKCLRDTPCSNNFEQMD